MRSRGGAFCLFVLSNSLIHACVSQVFFQQLMRVWWGFGSGVFFQLVGWWRGRQYFDRGRDRGFVLYISLFLQVLGW